MDFDYSFNAINVTIVIVFLCSNVFAKQFKTQTTCSDNLINIKISLYRFRIAYKDIFCVSAHLANTCPNKCIGVADCKSTVDELGAPCSQTRFSMRTEQPLLLQAPRFLITDRKLLLNFSKNFLTL